MEYRKATLWACIATSVVAFAWFGLRMSQGPSKRRLRGPAPQRSLFDLGPPSNKEGYYQWTWGDIEFLGDHELAELDPLRWSDWLNAAGMIADLEAYRTPRDAKRPVELMKGSASNEPHPPLKFGNVDEAIAYLALQTTTQAPVIQEKKVKIGVPGQCGQTPLDNAQALVFMAAGSALTVAAYALCMCCSCVFRRTCSGEKAESDDDSKVEPRLALQPGKSPQPYQGNFQGSELQALLADVEEEEDMRALPGVPGSRPNPAPSSALRAEAAREVERVLSAKGAREIFGGGTVSQQRTEYRRLVRLLHPDKKLIFGERANLALRRVVDCYKALNATR